MQPAQPFSPLPRPPLDPKPWRWGAWLGWSVLLVACLACSLIAAFFIAFGDSSTCNQTPTAHNLIDGQTHLIIAAGVLACPWVLAAFFSPRRWSRMLLGCVLGLVPLVFMSLTHLHAHDWTGGFCF